VQREVGAAGDVEEDAPRPVDRGLQQRAGDGIAGGIGGTRVAAAEADPHQGCALSGHDRLDVGEVQVDQAGLDDQVGDALHALTEHVIGDLQGFGEWHLFVGHIQEPLVRNDDQGVDLLPEGRGRLFGDRRRREPSKVKGLVTTPMVSAPLLRAISATTGAAPDPVPPPCRRSGTPCRRPATVLRALAGSPRRPRDRSSDCRRTQARVSFLPMFILVWLPNGPAPAGRC